MRLKEVMPGRGVLIARKENANRISQGEDQNE
jgi:hypothetical protein